MAPTNVRPQSRRFRPKRSLGQNFLIDTSILNQIVGYLNIQQGDTVLEIGAGTGTLTTRLAVTADEVLAVELDETLHEQLVHKCTAYPNVRPILADVLKLDIESLLEGIAPEHARVVGNLPYYITTPILMKLLDQRMRIAVAVLMVQLEVAERLVSPPGNRTYGAPSIAVAYHAESEILRKVPPTVFRPRPKVNSAIIRLTMRKRPAVDVHDEGQFFRIVRGAFRHRRKTLRNALLKSGVYGSDPSLLDPVLERSGVSPTLRPEKLGLEEYARLSNATSSLGFSV